MSELKTNRLPVLAIVGRPNVGKSTLFNRLTGQKRAIVDGRPGVTRDRIYAEAKWRGSRFILIDTGGFDPEPGTPLETRIQEQSRLATEEADVVLFLLDGKEGLNPVDRDAVDLLRRVKKPVFFAVNKIDTHPKEGHLYEFYGLGLEELFPVSAEHGLGVAALMDRILDAFPAAPQREVGEEARLLSLAVVGRPNVGKSTLVNRLLGYERSIVDTAPGTTRDALDSPFDWRGVKYILIDTAGIRRKARIVDRIERYSVIRALRSVDRADLIIHLIEGPEGVTDQDAHILGYAARRGKGLVVAVNKWDLVPEERRNTKAYRDWVFEKLPFVEFAPLVFISALTGSGIEAMMEAVERVAQSYQARVKTSALNEALREIFQRHAPPAYKGKQVKFYYATQTGSRPPTFVLFVNLPPGLTPDYRRYLAHELRGALSLQNSPIQLLIRPRRGKRG